MLVFWAVVPGGRGRGTQATQTAGALSGPAARNGPWRRGQEHSSPRQAPAQGSPVLRKGILAGVVGVSSSPCAAGERLPFLAWRGWKDAGHRAGPQHPACLWCPAVDTAPYHSPQKPRSGVRPSVWSAHCTCGHFQATTCPSATILEERVCGEREARPMGLRFKYSWPRDAICKKFHLFI